GSREGVAGVGAKSPRARGSHPLLACLARMTYWRPVEVFATFMKVVGEIEVEPPHRLTDVVNRVGDYMELRSAVAEPLSVNYPVLSKREERTVIAKQSVILI